MYRQRHSNLCKAWRADSLTVLLRGLHADLLPDSSSTAADSRHHGALLALALAAVAVGAAVVLQPDGAWAEAVAQHADAVQQSAQTASQEGSASAGLLRFLIVRPLACSSSANSALPCTAYAVQLCPSQRGSGPQTLSQR